LRIISRRPTFRGVWGCSSFGYAATQIIAPSCGYVTVVTGFAPALLRTLCA